MRKSISILLALVMLLTVLPVTITANAAEVINVSTAEELANACSTINANGGEYTINLTADITNGNIDINKNGAVVTVIGNGHTIARPNGYSSITVSNGATLNLGDGNSALTLSSGEDSEEPGIVYVLYDSVCNMYDKVTLKDHKGDNYLGGGVTVEGGTFHMYGGTIENCGIGGGSVCYGGGVAVYANGEFIMDGGTISGCYVVTNYTEELPLYENCYSGMGGGVFVTDGSVFTMNGGTISNNTATTFGGGVAMTLSDIETKIDPVTGEDIIDTNTGKPVIDYSNPKSKVTINSGTISENNAVNGAGVFVSGLIFAFAKVALTEQFDSGAPEDPGFYINGGENKAVEISSNEATDMGGGVLFIGMGETRNAQIYNAQIKNNTATYGAGVENYYFWTQLDIDGCVISENEAASNGGGVAAIQNKNDGHGTFGYTAIKNTTITGNTSGDRGAGVYYDSVSEIRISGKDVIQDNTYDGKNNNLNILSLEKPVTVIGDLTGSQIGLSDPTLWDDGKEDTAVDAVSTLRLTDGFKTNNASLIPADAFTSDHESWMVDYGEKKTEQGAETGRTYHYKADKYDNTVNVEGGGRIVKDGNSQFICLEAETFDTGTAEDVDTVYDDMYARYQRKYEDQGYSYYGDPFFYDPVSEKYAAIYYAGTVVYIYIGDHDAAYYESAGSCDCLMYAGVSHQQYANSGEIVYQYRMYSPDDSLYVSPTYELTASDVDLSFSTALDFSGNDTTAVYERNDLGIITSKYEINISSEVVDIQYDTVTTDYTNEVRLVRAPINYHINNTDIANAKYNGEDIFTSYVETDIGKEIKVGDTIEEFYTVPEVTPTADNSCPYIFKGWYYDKDNENDTRPVKFGTDKYSKDIYAHWIKVENVDKDAEDPYELPEEETAYGGFDLSGVQISERIIDTNFGYERMPGGLRFMSSLSMDVVNEINAIKPNNIEYGFVAAKHEEWIAYHAEKSHKLLYVSKTANGINTLDPEGNDDYFDFAKNINCTSRQANPKNGVVREDHRNYSDYLLYTLVITYEDGQGYDTNVLARPYIRYTDANGLERVAYSEYRGNSNVIGGCYTSYNAMA